MAIRSYNVENKAIGPIAQATDFLVNTARENAKMRREDILLQQERQRQDQLLTDKNKREDDQNRMRVIMGIAQERLKDETLTPESRDKWTQWVAENAGNPEAALPQEMIERYGSKGGQRMVPLPEALRKWLRTDVTEVTPKQYEFYSKQYSDMLDAAKTQAQTKAEKQRGEAYGAQAQKAQRPADKNEAIGMIIQKGLKGGFDKLSEEELRLIGAAEKGVDIFKAYDKMREDLVDFNGNRKDGVSDLDWQRYLRLKERIYALSGIAMPKQPGPIGSRIVTLDNGSQVSVPDDGMGGSALDQLTGGTAAPVQQQPQIPMGGARPGETLGGDTDLEMWIDGYPGE